MEADWYILGIKLKVPESTLDAIETDHRTVRRATLAMLKTWKRTGCSPYTWKTLLVALASNAVGQRALADKIAAKLADASQRL